MNYYQKILIAVFSSLFILPNAYVAKSEQVANKSTSVLANNSLSPEQIRQLAQAVTVKVLSTNKGGSGVLISKQGQTYTVLTNAHVISNKGSSRIQTPDDKIYTATVISKGDSLKGNDLAILQFQSQQNYQIVPLATNSNVSENQEVFAAGFPDDSNKLVISNGKISLLSTQPLVGGYQIGYTNEVRQGMSGGALLNQAGELIGINGLTNNAILTDAYAYQDGTKPSVEKLQQLRQLSFAVPIQTLAKVAPNLAIIPPQWRSQQQATKPAGNTFVDKVDNIAQQITVRIDLKYKDKNNQEQNGNGSGVIIAKQGNTYYVVTARHVVEDSYQHQIITPDGKRYAVQPDNIFKPEGLDAAIVKFTSKQTYSIATLSTYNRSFSDAFTDTKTSWVFISGFPKADRGNRKLTPGFISIGDALVQRSESNELLQAFLNRGYGLLYSNLSLPGMSGGPVLDVMGEVIGINTGIENPEISEIQIGFGYGVPSSSVLSLATQAGLKKESLKISSNKPPIVKNSEIDLLQNHPLFTIRKPSADANESDLFKYANQAWRIRKFSETITVLQEIIKRKPNFYQAHYALALVLGDGGEDPEKALAALDQATLLKPDYYEAWKFKSLVLFNLNKSSLALTAIDKAIEYGDNDLGLYLQRTAILSNLQRYPEALATIDKAIKIQPFYLSYFTRGYIRFQLQDFQGALSDYNQVIKLQPKFALAYVLRGASRYMLKDSQGGLADINQAIKLEPDNPQVYFLVGAVRSDLKDYQGALADYTKAIAINPQDAQAYKNRGYLYTKQKKWDLALADYTKAIAINPQDAQAYKNRGDVYYDEQKKWDLALADYTKVIAINPQDAQGYKNRGDVYYQQKKWDLALADYSQAIKLEPDNANAYLARGDVYNFQLKNYQAALADYNQGIKLQPDNAQAYFARGDVRFQLKDYQGALADYSQAIKLQPDNANTYFSRGDVYNFQLKNYQAALADYNQGIKLQPDNAQAYFARGDVRFQLKDYQGALADYNQGIKLQPDNANAYFGRGNVYIQLKNYQAALADFSQAIKLQPDNANAYFSRGVIYQIQRNDRAALAEYNQALAKDGKSALAIINIGYIKYENGDVDGAIAQWEKAVQINSTLAEPQMAIAVALYAKGEQQKALSMAQAALHLDKSFADVEVLKQNLWGTHLIDEARKLFANPSIQAFIKQ